MWQLSALGNSTTLFMNVLIEFIISFSLFVLFVWTVVKLYSKVSDQLSTFAIFSSFRVNNLANIIEGSSPEEYVRVLPASSLNVATELTPEEQLSLEDQAALRQLRRDIALLDITNYEPE